MKEIIVNENDSGQRVDRFLKKYLKKASLSFIYKNLRKKNITLNGKKTTPETLLNSGDVLRLYFSDETLEKFIEDKVNFKSKKFPRVIFEDENIILLNKPVGVLTHNDKREFETNMVDMMIDYLIARGEFNPRAEKTFRPALVNRLDRNTSGILIGAKNAAALRILNKAMRLNNIEKYYLALVYGKTPKHFKDESYLVKDGDKNKVKVQKVEVEEGKYSKTIFNTIASTVDYSLLSVNLITGRTHQIRTVLMSKGFPIVGDRKYFKGKDNELFNRKYSYDSQFLHNYKIIFKDIEGELSYLKNKTFYLNLPAKEEDIIEDIFKDRNIWRM
ncbi:RluA family pseudouridine synthase [Anaerosphaera multitolerans]|uniref:Pseudouridine synthase n=1 Tax=Anaerosphaera multitolerans TaxID=2487351 RepID=A0A437S6F5_9FIRM|nr:RluA family pseudouridine synthase [Anaerosphaera multitolerans]RVU54585.1 RluA family pseudouridine synthase [Anaerosphaera multitolerans]